MGANQWSAAGTHGPGMYRENTLRSFREAVAAGASFLEFDVQVTADGVPIVWHDNYIVSGQPCCAVVVVVGREGSGRLRRRMQAVCQRVGSQQLWVVVVYGVQ